MPRVRAPATPAPVPSIFETILETPKRILTEEVHPQQIPNSNIPYGQPISGTGAFIHFCKRNGGIFPAEPDITTTKIFKYVCRAISCLALPIISSLGCMYNLALGAASGAVWLVMSISNQTTY
ncbi:MAG: hypothetical protein WCP39_06670 [Chlamydiota bacterium]